MNITVLLWVVDILCYLIVTPFLKLCNGVLWELQQAIQSLMKECKKDARISSEYDDEVQSTSHTRNYKSHPQQPYDLSKTLPRNDRLEVVRQNTTAQILIMTKWMVRQNTVSRIESRKTAGSLPSVYHVMCLTFYLKIFPWIKCIMFSPVVILCIRLRLHYFNFDTDDVFCVKYGETRKVSLLWYQTPGSLLKNEAISEFFSMSFEIV